MVTFMKEQMEQQVIQELMDPIQPNVSVDMVCGNLALLVRILVMEK
jgi:hypothetical protein